MGILAHWWWSFIDCRKTFFKTLHKFLNRLLNCMNKWWIDWQKHLMLKKPICKFNNYTDTHTPCPRYFVSFAKEVFIYIWEYWNVLLQRSISIKVYVPFILLISCNILQNISQRFDFAKKYCGLLFLNAI